MAGIAPYESACDAADAAETAIAVVGINVAALVALLSQQDERVELLEAALRFYAETEHYGSNPLVENDCGELARDVLEAGKE